jgi:hypothetical protein
MNTTAMLILGHAREKLEREGCGELEPAGRRKKGFKRREEGVGF